MEIVSTQQDPTQDLIRRILVLETQLRVLQAENGDLRAGLRGSLMRTSGKLGYDVRRYASKVIAIKSSSLSAIADTAPILLPEIAVDPQTLRQLWADKERLASIERDRVYAFRRKTLEYEARLRQWASLQLKRRR